MTPARSSPLGVINHEELKFYRSVVALRNVVIHQYTVVDLEIIRRIIANRVNDP